MHTGGPSEQINNIFEHLKLDKLDTSISNEIQCLLNKHGELDEERVELIKDLVFFMENHTYRRKEVFYNLQA